MIVTPGQLNQRAEFYHQLGSMASAGVSVLESLLMMERNPPAAEFAPRARAIHEQIAKGSTFTEALRMQGKWLPDFDLALIEAGEQSGRLDACFQLLAEYYRQRASLIRTVISELNYPFFTLHFALLVFPLQAILNLVLQGDVTGFLMQKAQAFGIFYGIVFAVVYAFQASHGFKWRMFLDKMFSRVPMIAKARKYLAVARLSAALEALLSAGVSIIDAWQLSAAASGSPMLQQEIADSKKRVLAGQTPAEVVSTSKYFPEMFRSLYQTGEVSGQLDTTLKRLHNLYQEEATRALRAVSQWIPRVVYLGIMLGIGYQVVNFYASYFDQATKGF